MSHPPSDRELPEGLQAFEKALETPIVPGEVVAWTETVRQTCEALASPLRRALDERHRKVYGEIGEEEPELLAKIEELIQEDEEIRDTYDRLCFLVDRLIERGEELEPDEMRTAHAHEELVEEGLAFVIQVRKQELAVQTWLIEAFDRDNGTVD